MKAPRLLLEKLCRAICCAAMAVVLLFAPSAAAQTEGESPPVRAEGRVGDSRLATLGDLRHLENEMRAELREIHATIRWLLIALIAVLGLPQLSAWWDRRLFHLRWPPRLGRWGFSPSPPPSRGDKLAE